jgi:hypothetical protein
MIQSAQIHHPGHLGLHRPLTGCPSSHTKQLGLLHATQARAHVNVRSVAATVTQRRQAAMRHYNIQELHLPSKLATSSTYANSRESGQPHASPLPCSSARAALSPTPAGTSSLPPHDALAHAHQGSVHFLLISTTTGRPKHDVGRYDSEARPPAA